MNEKNTLIHQQYGGAIGLFVSVLLNGTLAQKGYKCQEIVVVVESTKEKKVNSVAIWGSAARSSLFDWCKTARQHRKCQLREGETDSGG